MNKEPLLDLDKKQMGLLEEIIKRHIPYKTIWAYGSRVTWKAQNTSDLDLAVFDCASMEILNFKDALEESSLLVSVDVMDWNTIPDSFKENIKNKYVVLQEKPELKNWREVKVAEIATLNYGKALPEHRRVAGNIPVYSSAGLIGWHNEELVNSGGLIIGRKGNAGSVYKSAGPFFPIDTTFFITKNDTECNLEYLFYKLSNLDLEKLNSDSVIPGLNRDVAYAQKILLPPLPEQKAIAEVLSSLDDNIDLLHRQNKTLEDMAQTLFRQWFVEKADKKLDVGKLGDVIEIFDRKRIPLSKIDREKKKEGVLYPYYGAAQIMDYVNDYIFEGEYILMAEDGSVKTDEGYPVLQYAIGKFWVNNHTHVLKAKNPYQNFFIWCFLSKLNIEQYITGAVQPKINQTNLNSIKFPKYPLQLVLKFQTEVKSIFKKALSNQSQIHTLENLRDALLPKLMSGNIHIPYNYTE